MIRPEEFPPKDCGNFLADLPRYLGLEDTALQQEQVYTHYQGCARCRQNLGTAREMAGAFHGVRSRILPRTPLRHRDVEKAVTLALRQNRAELAQTFFDLGKNLTLEALRTHEGWKEDWLSGPRPKRDIQGSRTQAVEIANDCALLAKEQSGSEWDPWREEAAEFRMPKDTAGLLAESTRYLTVSRRIMPTHESAAVMLAINARLRQDFATAIEIYQRLLQESSNYLRRRDAHNNLAESLLQLRRFEEAASHAKKAHRLDPEQPIVFFTYAHALLLAGRKTEAYASLEAISANERFSRPAKSRFESFGPGPLADYLKKNFEEIRELESVAPNVYAPDVAQRIRKEVRS